MSTDSHLAFKNVLLFLQKQNTKNIKQNIEVGIWHGNHYHMAGGHDGAWTNTEQL